MEKEAVDKSRNMEHPGIFWNIPGNIPEYPGTFRDIPEYRIFTIVMRKICKIKFSRIKLNKNKLVPSRKLKKKTKQKKNKLKPNKNMTKLERKEKKEN